MDIHTNFNSSKAVLKDGVSTHYFDEKQACLANH